MSEAIKEYFRELMILTLFGVTIIECREPDDSALGHIFNSPERVDESCRFIIKFTVPCEVKIDRDSYVEKLKIPPEAASRLPSESVITATPEELIAQVKKVILKNANMYGVFDDNEDMRKYFTFKCKVREELWDTDNFEAALELFQFDVAKVKSATEGFTDV